MVIGPTPPGTGVMAPAMPRDCFVVDIADEARCRRSGVAMRLMPTSITMAPGLTCFAPKNNRLADRRDQQIGLLT